LEPQPAAGKPGGYGSPLVAALNRRRSAAGFRKREKVRAGVVASEQLLLGLSLAALGMDRLDPRFEDQTPLRRRPFVRRVGPELLRREGGKRNREGPRSRVPLGEPADTPQVDAAALGPLADAHLRQSGDLRHAPIGEIDLLLEPSGHVTPDEERLV